MELFRKRPALYREDNHLLAARLGIFVVLYVVYVVCSRNPHFHVPFNELVMGEWGNRNIYSVLFVVLDAIYLFCSIFWACLTILLLPELPFVHLPTDESLDLLFSDFLPIIVYILLLHIDEVVGFIDRFLEPLALVYLFAFVLHRVSLLVHILIWRPPLFF